MNIFVLDKSAKKAAEYHCDKHVVKMILESAQMKSTAHWLHLLWSNNKNLKDFKRIRDVKLWLLENTNPSLHPPYSMTHVRHPCTIWVSSTVQNYMWHYDLLFYLCKEYTKRYGKIHKTANYLSWFKNNIPQGIKSDCLEDFTVCMKEEYKIAGNPIESYRNYYIKDKVRFAKWKTGNTPLWFSKGITSCILK